MNFNNQQPIYLQIADYVLEGILSKHYQAGDRIESVREMAANTQVNPNTVMRTFTFLQDKDIIFNRRGIGFFIADDALKRTQAIKREEFVQQQLPELFKMMDLLGIKISDLESLYQSHYQSQQNTQNGAH